MCFASSSVRDLSHWNWEDDHIIHECIVPSSRPVVGYLKGHAYDIDVREFLITGRNEIVERTLSRKESITNPGARGCLQASRRCREFSLKTSDSRSTIKALSLTVSESLCRGYSLIRYAVEQSLPRLSLGFDTSHVYPQIGPVHNLLLQDGG